MVRPLEADPPIKGYPSMVEISEIVARACRARGLPPKIEDPATLSLIAMLFRGSDDAPTNATRRRSQNRRPAINPNARSLTEKASVYVKDT